MPGACQGSVLCLLGRALAQSLARCSLHESLHVQVEPCRVEVLLDKTCWNPSSPARCAVIQDNVVVKSSQSSGTCLSDAVGNHAVPLCLL
jgi:hypothetical protein